MEMFQNGSNVRTTTVIVAFSDDLPAKVRLSLLNFKVRLYVPAHMSCAGCNIYCLKQVCRIPAEHMILRIVRTVTIQAKTNVSAAKEHTAPPTGGVKSMWK